jgi:uncharacterized protein (TIRG00374 family)
VQRSLRILLFVGGLALFVFLCARLGLGELVAAARNARPAYFIAFLALSVGVFFTYAARWWIVLDAMDEGRRPPSLTTLVRLRAAEHAVSSMIPSAHLSGEPVRALLLRRRGRDWTRAISSVAMDRMLDVSASSVAGPIYVAIFFFANDVSAAAAPWMMAVMIALLVALVAFYVRAYRGGRLISFLARGGFLGPARGKLEKIEQELSAFLRTPKFFAALAVSFAAEMLVIAELWMLARAFALPISLPTLVGVMVGMGIAQLLPIPAAIGSLEATEVGVLALAGGAAPLGLAVGLIVRLRETLWIVVGFATLYVEGLSWRLTTGNASAIDANA